MAKISIELAKQFFAWAKRDKICASAVFMGILGLFPHTADWLYKVFVLVVTGSEAIAQTLGGK